MRTTVAAFLLAIAVSGEAAAQWASVGDMPAPRRDAHSLTFQNDQAVVSVSAVSPHVVRVRFQPGSAFPRDHSYAVVSRDLGEPAARIEVGASQSTIRTAALTVRIGHRPFRVAIDDARGQSLDADDMAMGTATSGRTARVWKRLRDDEQIYGFGEKSGRLNRRGKNLGGYSFAMWNTDAYGYDMGTDPIYASFPMFLVMRNGRAHGVFLDNTFRSSFDVGKESQHRLSFGVEDGELDYYFIDGPHPKDVISRYTELTGRMPLPPLWALGFHQCRYSYYPEAKVRFIADNFRVRQIPADTLWLDIHYLDGYNPFTWDTTRFPNPAGLVRDLRSQGFRLVTIVDPHPRKQPGWAVYDSGLAGGHFVTQADGRLYEDRVWPANAERNPGPSVFPDFSRPAARDWWGGLYRSLTDIGIAGIWNDMNEPAVFRAPTWTMPLDVRHDNEGLATDHREIHNVYGMLMTKATYEGLLALKPDERPFVLTRATFSGGQRYAALWPGDNQSRWEDLRHSLPMLMSLGLSGMPFVGSDIGGFGDSPSAELFTRWLQAGVFYPFMRVHTAIGTDDQEPWSFGPQYERWNRRAIELRYELLPHIYDAMHQSAETGVPAMRPLFLEYPDDPRTWEMDDQFMFGADLLVAPVLHEGRLEREVYLPKGTWYDFFTGSRFDGGTTVRRRVTVESLPVFVREGAFVFRQPVVQHTGEMPGQPLRVHVYPAARSERVFYEDAGQGFAYRSGGHATRVFSQHRSTAPDGTDERATIEIGSAQGSHRPAARDLELHVRWAGSPAAVSVGAGSSRQSLRTLPRVAVAELSRHDAAWSISDDGFVIVRQPDRFDGLSIVIER